MRDHRELIHRRQPEERAEEADDGGDRTGLDGADTIARLRTLFLRLAYEIETAESDSAFIDVIADIDRYVRDASRYMVRDGHGSRGLAPR